MLRIVLLAIFLLPLWAYSQKDTLHVVMHESGTAMVYLSSQSQKPAFYDMDTLVWQQIARQHKTGMVYLKATERVPYAWMAMAVEDFRNSGAAVKTLAPKSWEGERIQLYLDPEPTPSGEDTLIFVIMGGEIGWYTKHTYPLLQKLTPKADGDLQQVLDLHGYLPTVIHFGEGTDAEVLKWVMSVVKANEMALDGLKQATPQEVNLLKYGK